MADFGPLNSYLKSQIELGEESVFFEEPFSFTPEKSNFRQTIVTKPVLRQTYQPLQTEVKEEVKSKSSLKSKWNSLEVQISKKQNEIPEKIETEEQFKAVVRKNAIYARGGEIIWGFGNSKPLWMFVFESPWEQNLSQDVFWESGVGQMLIRMFESLGADAKQSFITFFHKKPLSKKTTPLMALELRKILAEEVRLIKPQKMVFWGENLHRQITKSSETILQAGGNSFEFEAIPSIALIDPHEMILDVRLKKITWKEHLPRSGFFSIPG